MDSSLSDTSNVESEFDAYATEYSAGMENPVKRLMGRSEILYMTPKVRWLLRDLQRRPLASVSPAAFPSLLDFGCGTGLFLSEIQRLGFRGEISGCDVSGGMLDVAAQVLTLPAPTSLQLLVARKAAPYPDASFDVIVVCCVLHHIPVDERPAVLADLWRILKPGGRLYFFEHNPRNPLTRWVVKRTPIDRNAVLVEPQEILEAMAPDAHPEVHLSYLLYHPPRLRWLAWVDRVLAGLPFGAQYVFACGKPIVQTNSISVAHRKAG